MCKETTLKRIYLMALTVAMLAAGIVSGAHAADLKIGFIDAERINATAMRFPRRILRGKKTYA